MRALALLLLAFALPAAAQDARLPALYDVIGVAADDVLNVRAAPRATSRIVGDIRPAARHIEVIELSETGDWGRVLAGEGMGWASMRFLDRQAGQGWDVPPAVTGCFGAEPFWGLDMEPGTMLFTTPEGRSTIQTPTIEPVGGRREPWIFLTETVEGPMQGILSRQMCSDGMSDMEFGYRLDLIVGGRGGLTGCCTLSP